MKPADEELLAHVREMDEGTRTQLVLGISRRIDELQERKRYAEMSPPDDYPGEVAKQLEEAKHAETWLVELVRLWVIASA